MRENGEKIEDYCKFLYSNVDSLLNKKDELLAFIDEKKVDIIALTEITSKTQNNVLNVEYDIPGFECFINKNIKRGVAIYVRENLQAQLYSELERHNFDENVFCQFKTKDGMKVLVGCLYRSPSSDHTNTENMINLIKNVGDKNFDYVCITGDFNWRNLNWDSWVSTNETENEFFEALRDSYLVQLVKNPTRRRTNQRPSLLDLILVNDEELASEVEHHSSIGKSDHEVLLFDLYVNKGSKNGTEKERFVLNKGRYEKMKEEMRDTNWDIMNEMNMDTSWIYFRDKILKSMNENIPKKKVGGMRRVTPAWMSKSLLKKIKKKYHLYKRYLLTKDGIDYQRYIFARNECAKKVRKAKRENEKKIAKGCKKNNKMFWKHVRTKTKANSGISPLDKGNGETATGDAEKANILNDYFSSVFTRENVTNLPYVSEGENSGGATLKEVIVTPDAVKEKLQKLDVNKACGPDGIPPRVLRELAEEIATPLCALFNKSLQTGEIPEQWKTATVTAIFKKGSRNEPGNYRPVSLTCIVCKVLEQFIRDSVVEHMTILKLYSDCQHGFRQGRSCMTQLLEVMEDFTKMFDDKEPFDVVYLDFRKAFDSVPHERLLEKLKGYGITGNVISWVRAFLTGRIQRVKVGEEMSDNAPVLSGIPQGSILGPILFTLFINDLPNSVSSVCKIFADDTKLYNVAKNSDLLQNDIDNLIDWSDTWDLHFNAGKCKVIHFGINNPCHTYTMNIGGNESEITVDDEEKDLGVIFDKSLHFEKHVTEAIKKANKTLGLIKRSFSYLDESTFCLLYKALVRPHLEYGNVIWAPLYKKYSKNIERVQRRATKLLKSLKNLTYIERLDKLKLPSLKYRRLRGDYIQAYKIFNEIDGIDKNKFFTHKSEQRTRNSTGCVFIQQCRTKLRQNVFSFRVSPLWNKLPLHVKNASNMNRFKNLLDIHLRNFVYDFDD